MKKLTFNRTDWTSDKKGKCYLLKDNTLKWYDYKFKLYYDRKTGTYKVIDIEDNGTLITVFCFSDGEGFFDFTAYSLACSRTVNSEGYDTELEAVAVAVSQVLYNIL